MSVGGKEYYGDAEFIGTLTNGATLAVSPSDCSAFCVTASNPSVGTLILKNGSGNTIFKYTYSTTASEIHILPLGNYAVEEIELNPLVGNTPKLYKLF